MTKTELLIELLSKDMAFIPFSLTQSIKIFHYNYLKFTL